MAKNDFVKPKAAESFPLGHAKENKDASAYTGFVYPTGGGNDIGVYKQPMPNADTQPTTIVAKPGNPMDELNISVGGISKGNYPAENKNPVTTMRGAGAATKGTKCRGPMA
mgnify:CR=1 FL=1